MHIFAKTFGLHTKKSKSFIVEITAKTEQLERVN